MYAPLGRQQGIDVGFSYALCVLYLYYILHFSSVQIAYFITIFILYLKSDKCDKCQLMACHAILLYTEPIHGSTFHTKLLYFLV